MKEERGLERRNEADFFFGGLIVVLGIFVLILLATIYMFRSDKTPIFLQTASPNSKKVLKALPVTVRAVYFTATSNAGFVEFVQIVEVAYGEEKKPRYRLPIDVFSHASSDKSQIWFVGDMASVVLDGDDQPLELKAR